MKSGAGIPNKSIILGDFGEIPLVTIDDTAFPRLERLLKCFNQNTRDGALLQWKICHRNSQGLSQKMPMVC